MENQLSQLLQKKINPNGYTSILTDSGWKKEHVWVVETFLGRELEDGECVHHINFCKQDNRIDNLALFTKSEHSHFHRQILQHGYTQPRRTEIFNNIIQVKLRGEI